MKSLIGNTYVTDLEDKAGTGFHSCGRVFINLSLVMGMAYANSLEKEMFLLIIFVSAFFGHPLPSASRVKSCFDIVEARLLLLARLDEER